MTDTETRNSIREKTILLVKERTTELARKYAGNTAQELHYWTAQAIANDAYRYYRDYMTEEYDAAEEHKKLQESCSDAVYGTPEQVEEAISYIRSFILETSKKVTSWIYSIPDQFAVVSFFRVLQWNDWSKYCDFRPDNTAQLAAYAVNKFTADNLNEISWAFIARVNN